MKRILLFVAVAFVLFGTPTALATQTPEDIAQKIIQQGHVDPSQYDTPEHHAAHVDALAWMKSLKAEDIGALANHLQKPGKKVHSEKPWLALLTGAVGGSPHALALGGYEANLNQCAAQGVAGICNIRQFGLRGNMRRYNQDVVNLAAAYIRLAEMGQIARPGARVVPPAPTEPKNIFEARFQPPEQLRQPEQMEEFFYAEDEGIWYMYDAEQDTYVPMPK